VTDHMEEVSRLIGGQTAPRDDVVEQLSTSDVLHDDENIRRCVDDFIAASQR
jgi:hypothetical protein